MCLLFTLNVYGKPVMDLQGGTKEEDSKHNADL